MMHAIVSLTSLRGAVERGLEFLLARQDRDGAWRDFRIVGFKSDEWVSAYVALCLASFPHDGVRGAVSHALDFLREGWRVRGGLGYGRRTPIDSDSTAVGIRLLTAVELAGELIQAGLQVLWIHYDSETGGFRTYLQRNLLTQSSTFTIPSPCVSANVGTALVEAHRVGFSIQTGVHGKLLHYLEKSEEQNGLWYGRWWDGPTFPTRQVLEYMFATGMTDSFQARSQHWLDTQERDGSWGLGDLAINRCLETACALDILRFTRTPPASPGFQTGVEWLIRAQKPDGSWESDRYLMFPRHDDPMPWRNVRHQKVVRDGKNILVTAKALESLWHATRLLEDAGLTR